MTFKEKVKSAWEKKKSEWKEESKFKQVEREAYAKAEREARLKYAGERARAVQSHRYSQFKKQLNRPRSSFGGGSNDFFSQQRPSLRPQSRSYFSNQGVGFPGLGGQPRHHKPKTKYKRKKHHKGGRRIVIYQ